VPILSHRRVIGVRARPVGSRVFGEAAIGAVVVAADGRRSSLVRALHPRLGDPLRTGDRSWFGLQTHYDHPGTLDEDRVELCLFPGGYAGLSRVEGGRVNLGVLTTVAALRACNGSPDRLVRDRILANPAARRILGDAPPPATWKTVGPLRFRARRAVASGALFLGDAAGTVDPFCGEGISFALRSAELALPAALEGVSAGRLERAAARRYERAWQAMFAPIARRARLLGWLLTHPRAASIALAALDRPGRTRFARVVAATRPGSRPVRSVE
jgi:flavin-dependent dehydrogenase